PTVVFADQRGIAIPGGEVAQEEIQTARDQMDRGGFQRFDETTRQTKRQAIARPELAPMPRREGNDPRLVQAGAAEVAKQSGACFGVAAKATGINVTLADATLQRNAPHPS